MEIVKGRRVAEERSPKLPDDLITEIMSRVPAMDLMRFTCVSKSWCSFISTDPYFSTLQLERTASQHRPFLLLTKKEGQKDGGRLYSSHIWTDLDSVEDRNIGSREREIHDPFCDHQFIDQNILHIEDTRVIGSCRGLLVLEQFRSHRMVVTNPTTKKHHLVPPNPVYNVVFCGFGYDRVHDCYKLVTQIKPADYFTLELMVYDVNKGTWRNLQFGMWWRSQIDDEDGYSQLYDHRAKCVDGAVYWCIDPRERTHFGPTRMKKMVCFLLAEEEFHVVETPDFGEVRNYPNITDLEGRLCLDCKGPNGTEEFWMIDKEYDKTQESAYSWRWTKFLVISDLYSMLPPRIRIDRLVPVCFSACRNKILFDINSSELFWYDLANKKFCEVNNHGKAYTKASYCIPSLVGNGIL